MLQMLITRQSLEGRSHMSIGSKGHGAWSSKLHLANIWICWAYQHPMPWNLWHMLHACSSCQASPLLQSPTQFWWVVEPGTSSNTRGINPSKFMSNLKNLVSKCDLNMFSTCKIRCKRVQHPQWLLGCLKWGCNGHLASAASTCTSSSKAFCASSSGQFRRYLAMLQQE